MHTGLIALWKNTDAQQSAWRVPNRLHCMPRLFTYEWILQLRNAITLQVDLFVQGKFFDSVSNACRGRRWSRTESCARCNTYKLECNCGKDGSEKLVMSMQASSGPCNCYSHIKVQGRGWCCHATLISKFVTFILLCPYMIYIKHITCYSYGDVITYVPANPISPLSLVLFSTIPQYLQDLPWSLAAKLSWVHSKPQDHCDRTDKLAKTPDAYLANSWRAGNLCTSSIPYNCWLLC